MGEIADMMLEGEMCQYCGEYLGEGNGFPVACPSCADVDGDETPAIRTKKSPKVRCPHCKKRVAEIGMQQHINAKHGGKP